MSYNCNFLDVDPFTTPIRTRTELDKKYGIGNIIQT